MDSEKLTQSLIEQTIQIIKQVENLKNFDLKQLTWKQNVNTWNILECLQHLNLYGDFYLPEIENKIKNSHSKKDDFFTSGFLGNYFAKTMLPKEKLNKMKTFKDKNPLNQALDKSTIDKFIKQQYTLLDLLNQSKAVSLNKIRIEISITSLIKLKLGDTFQFYINHIIRHLNQIQGIQNEMQTVLY